MKRYLALGLLSFSSLAYGQTAALPVYDCVQNGIQAVTSGLKSSNYLQGVIPYCTVTIYLTGTTTIATTNPQTPLQAKSDGSIPPIYATTGVGYDVKFSGGIYPNVYTTPVTLTDVQVGGGGGGGLTAPVLISQGGTGQTTLPLAQAALGINGPRYNVMNYGACGNWNGSTGCDDTAAIQAAFTACWSNATSPQGGIVEFPGQHNYKITSTINGLDGCRIEGTIGNIYGGYGPPEIFEVFPSQGVTSTVTGFTVTSNCTTGGSGCTYTAAFPATASGIGTQNRLAPYVVSFTGTNSYTANQWVEISGCSTAGGLGLNRSVLQVASSSGTGFVAVAPEAGISLGTFTDSCTVTSRSVVLAFDGNARYEQEVKDIEIATSDANSIGILFGSRVDTGTRIYNTWVEGTSEYNYYFAVGGINIDFDKGWRGGAAQQGSIYWRVGSGDNLSLLNGTVDNRSTASASGPLIILDGQATCGIMSLNVQNVKVEINTSIQPGEGVVTMYDCPLGNNYPQFRLSFNEVFLAPSTRTTAGFNFTTLSMIPASGNNLLFFAENTQMQSGYGANTTLPFIGIPELTAHSITGNEGDTPLLAYGNSNNSGGQSVNLAAPNQLFGDTNIDQLWQYGVKASDFLYSDTAFAALPNATTLYPGQIVAPPIYWTASSQQRYALNTVKSAGTTGTLNSGSTTCATPIFNISTVSVSGTTATFTGTTSNATKVFANSYYAFAGTDESWLNGGGFYTLANNTSTTMQITVPSGHDGYTNASDTGTATDHYHVVCSSATDLNSGEYVSIGTNTILEINIVDATNASAVNVLFVGSTYPVATASTLSFAAPTLGPEMQILIKAAAAPTTGTWVAGDEVQNNGSITSVSTTSGWLCTVSGTPGTWIAQAAGGVSSITAADGTMTVTPTTGPATVAVNLAGAFTWTGSQVLGNTSSLLIGSGASVISNANFVLRPYTPAISGTNVNGPNLSFIAAGYPTGGPSAFASINCSAVITNTVQTPITTLKCTGTNSGSLASTFGADFSLLTAGFVVPSTFSMSGCGASQYVKGDGTGCGTPSGAGTVITSGSPASGNIAVFSSSTAITAATAAQVGALLNLTQYGIVYSTGSSGAPGTILPSSWTTGHTFVPAWQPSGSALAPVVVDMTYAAALSYTPANQSTTINGHPLSSNVTVSASDLTTGTLPHAQLPTLLSGDIPNNAANTSGTAANLSGTPALPNGVTATTQSAGDNSTKLATTAYIDGTFGAGHRPWACDTGVGDGLNAITAGTYLQTMCQNTTGVSVTLTGLSCYIDSGSSSTMNAAGNTLGALLTGAVTCSTSFSAGTQSANVTLTNGDYIKFTFVADGTAKQTTWVVKGTY